MTAEVDLLLASINFWPVVAGPALRFQRYAHGLRARGVQMRVLAGAFDGLPAHEQVDGLSVHRVPLPAGRWMRTAYYRQVVRRCAQAAGRPDVIQLFTLSLQAIPWLLRLRRLGIPCMFVQTLLPTLQPDPRRRRWQIHRLRWPLQLVDCIVTSSSVMKQRLQTWGVSARTEVVPNGVDLTRFRPVASPDERLQQRLALGLDPTAELLLFIGHIIPRKGVDLLVEAWAGLCQTHPQAHLLLVGGRLEKGPSQLAAYHRRIKQMIAYSGAPERVILTGPVENVEAYLRAADVFIFPSAREGMPNVVPEAMATGLPSILTPFVGLPAEFGRAGEEYLMAERTAPALAEAIGELLANPARRATLGASARYWVERHLDLETSLDRYAELYRELAACSQRR